MVKLVVGGDGGEVGGTTGLLASQFISCSWHDLQHCHVSRVTCHVSRSHAPARGHGLQLVLPLELSAREVRVVDLVALVPEDVPRRVVVVARHRGLPG